MKININHGNGGKETSGLIDEIFMRYFKNEIGQAIEDAAVLDMNGRVAFTTDSFVVKPIFFPGGDIGRLAVCGTVNDLLTTGAKPKYLSASFIIEEGFNIPDLERIACSMAEAAAESGVLIVTGDTKVIEGSGNIYINTAGVGQVSEIPVSFKNAEEGDSIIVTGSLGNHHACILSARMNIKNNIKSDAAPLNHIIEGLKDGGIELHGIRDITRGGLATILNEISENCGLEGILYEKELPVDTEVDGLCQILGVEPVYMGNEGKMLIVVRKDQGDAAVEIIRSRKYGENAKIIGEFKQGSGVVMATEIGGQRNISPLTGDSLPRIC